MREQLTEFLATVDPLFVVAGIAALMGLALYYGYSGFINKNYTQIKWFRRLFLPHVTRAINQLDEQYDDIDMQGVYVETNVREREHVFDLHLDESDTMTEGVKKVGDELISQHFRPEVILASLGRDPENQGEVGNFVLTAPEKNHTDVPVMGRLYDIFVMFTSKYQLHVRIYYDENKHRLRFYAHHELNPYNPLYAKKHLQAKDFNTQKGVRMFEQYKKDIEQYGVELVE